MHETFASSAIGQPSGGQRADENRLAEGDAEKAHKGEKAAIIKAEAAEAYAVC
jgi:hypothetical protein